MGSQEAVPNPAAAIDDGSTAYPSSATRQDWHHGGLTIPWTEEAFMEHLIVEAGLEGLVALGLLPSKRQPGLGPQELLFRDLSLRNGRLACFGSARGQGQ